jgi:hypothetical protein
LGRSDILDGVMSSASRRRFGRDELGCVWQRKHAQLYCIRKYPGHNREGGVDVSVACNDGRAIAGVGSVCCVTYRKQCRVRTAQGPWSRNGDPAMPRLPHMSKASCGSTSPAWRAYATSPLLYMGAWPFCDLKAREHSPEPRASTNSIPLTGIKGSPSPNRQNAPSIRHLRRTSPRSPPPPAPHTKHPLPCKTPTN